MRVLSGSPDNGSVLSASRQCETGIQGHEVARTSACSLNCAKGSENGRASALPSSLLQRHCRGGWSLKGQAKEAQLQPVACDRCDEHDDD